VGRILYHWEGASLSQPNWTPTGEIIRVDRDAGESVLDRDGKEWIQSPYTVHHNGLYYMFYGGHGTGIDIDGKPVPRGDPRMEGQICLMTSRNGRTWARHRNDRGYSRLFIAPGETRDPCLLNVDGTWHLYYAGYHDHDRAQAGFYLRTSSNLLHWSDWQLVHQDTAYGPGPWDTECPHVVYRRDDRQRRGAYYLFRTEDYASAKTHVFCSLTPTDFGIGDASAHYVCTIAVAAPEIVVDADGTEYITSNHDLVGGTRLYRLRWETI
jgi:beta-fructofuranosidase